ncbi:MAG: ATP synthase F1 subunit delta [Chitinophagaceae bacterium]|jgi:F-type H+-transporting ATPase subunit delta|nr:ATP synthase F1 subunit delta [Chitinophagaceae bacterium]
MTNPRLAERYAKSLIDLAVENGKLEEVHQDAQRIIQLCKLSRDFDVMLKSPIIKGDKKSAVINQLSQGKVTEITRLFLNLLVRKGRENNLREIMHVFCDKYDSIKGINRINLTTAVPVGDDVVALMVKKIEKETNLSNISINKKVDESLVGGFVLEYNNFLVDRSVRRFLKEVKKEYSKNEYQYNIR